ncbi:MAG: alpha-L-rhamnosidase C-terminal domain-containing protein [Bacteroidota bacterium]
MKILATTFLLLTVLSCSLIAQNAPAGLLTDLLSGTGGNRYPNENALVTSNMPSFSWIVPGVRQGTMQLKYRILLADSKEKLDKGKGNIWDSGFIKSAASVAVLYAGPALQPNRTYYWKVKVVTNTDGESNWSFLKVFTTGNQLETYKASTEKLRKARQVAKTKLLAANNYQTFDFGKDAFGQLNLTLNSETGNDTVLVHMGETQEHSRVNSKPAGTIRYRMQKLVVKKGEHSYTVNIEADKRNTGPGAIKMPDYIGEVLPFRYVGIEGMSIQLPVSKVSRMVVNYLFRDNTSNFKCSNDTINQIWELCKYSIKATSFAGIYVDGDRERIPYEADALINQLGHYGVDREFCMARATSEYLLEKPTWPTEWILQALIIAWNDYLYTGDSRSLAANYDILKNRTLTQLIEKNGLISTTTGLQTPAFTQSINFNGPIRDIVDWPVSETDGFVFNTYNAVTNAFHYKALQIMEEVARVLHKNTDAAYYRTAHQKLKTVYNDTFLDAGKGLYKDGNATDHSSLHANMFALNFDLVPEAHKLSVLNFIRSRGMASSVYGSQFLMEALYKGGDEDHALSLLSSGSIRSWYNMIRVGSTITLEAWDNSFKPNQDWNHAWGAAPANIISRKLMGVEPLTPGFETVFIKPQVGTLSYADATVPTIRGPISLSVKNNPNNYQLHVVVPANMKAMIYLPKKFSAARVTSNGKAIVIGVDSAGLPEPISILSGTYTFSMTAK